MKKNIMVVFGGKSSEHEVSKLSAKAVLKNINKNKYNVLPVGITRDGVWIKYDRDIDEIDIIELKELADNNKIGLPIGNTTNEITEKEKTVFKDIDIIFPVLHGPNGEDGTIQGLFELLDKPYVGCGVLSSAIGMDKAFSKIIFEKAGIPQGEYILITRMDYHKNSDKVVGNVEEKIKYPCFVKPSNAGSSIGVSKARNRIELQKGIELAVKYDRRILIEEELVGKEIECAVLGNENPIASVIGEIKPCNEFYDYEAKYLAGESKAIIPADVSRKLSDKVRDYAVRAHKALDCSIMGCNRNSICRFNR